MSKNSKKGERLSGKNPSRKEGNYGRTTYSTRARARQHADRRQQSRFQEGRHLLYPGKWIIDGERTEEEQSDRGYVRSRPTQTLRKRVRGGEGENL